MRAMFLQFSIEREGILSAGLHWPPELLFSSSSQDVDICPWFLVV